VFMAAGGGEQSSGKVLNVLKFIDFGCESRRGRCCSSQVGRL